MASTSSIEWTQMTWNPITGCTKVSTGCKNCYAERFAKRLQIMGAPRYANGFRVTIHEDLLDLPLRWKAPRIIFVNSMSDLFHEEVPNEFIARIFDVMNRCPQHTFQVLTKRSHRMGELAGRLKWSENIWMGVSVEDNSVLYRIAELRQIPANVRFLSLEPLLGPLSSMDLNGIHWVIVGGESGPKARPMSADWVRDIREQCEVAGIAFFFKQWGGTMKHKTGRLLDGHIYNNVPQNLTIGSSVGNV